MSVGWRCESRGRIAYIGLDLRIEKHADAKIN
jgi:hypothetical protein